MKFSLVELVLVVLLTVECRGAEFIYKKDFEIYRAHDGATLKPFVMDIPLNHSDSLYHEAEFAGEFLHPNFQGPNDSERVKRRHNGNDFLQTYESFLQENFGISNSNIQNAEKNASHEEISEEKTCKVTHKDGKRCIVCNNDKTNANTETCSYFSSSKPKKYAFKSQRTYRNGKKDQGDIMDEEMMEDTVEYNKKVDVDDNQGVEKTVQISAKPVNRFIDPVPNTDKDYTTLETHLLPFVGNVDKLIQNFNKKDWSECHGKIENGLVCYYCKDKTGEENEQCVYNSADSVDSKEKAEVVPRTSRSVALPTSPFQPVHPLRKGNRIFKRTTSMKIHAIKSKKLENSESHYSA